MVTHKFKFTLIDRARPLLDIRITNPKNGKAIYTWALIDPGSDICAFPKRFAKILKCKLEKAGLRAKKVRTGAGVARVYFSVCNIEILGPKADAGGNAKTDNEENRDVLFCPFTNLTVAFLPKLENPLLGVHDFLDRLILEIDYPRKEFSMGKP